MSVSSDPMSSRICESGFSEPRIDIFHWDSYWESDPIRSSPTAAFLDSTEICWVDSQKQSNPWNQIAHPRHQEGMERRIEKQDRAKVVNLRKDHSQRVALSPILVPLSIEKLTRLNACLWAFEPNDPTSHCSEIAWDHLSRGYGHRASRQPRQEEIGCSLSSITTWSRKSVAASDCSCLWNACSAL